jgi:hypothetical protein
MANRPAQLLVALLRRSKMKWNAAFLCACRRRLRAARRQISNDRKSGEGRRAGLKRRPLRRDKNEIEITEMLDGSGRERHRQQRRIRQERGRSEMDGRADRAIIVSLAGRMLRRTMLGRRRFRCRYARDGGTGCELFEMDVSEREGKLQRHRCKREPSAPSSLGPNPTHQANRAKPTGINLSPDCRRAMASELKPFGDCVMDPSRGDNVTDQCFQQDERRPDCNVITSHIKWNCEYDV